MGSRSLTVMNRSVCCGVVTTILHTKPVANKPFAIHIFASSTLIVTSSSVLINELLCISQAALENTLE